MPQMGAGAIRNDDCVHMIKLVDRAMLEIKDSASAGVNEYSEADKIRLTQYILNFTTFLDFSSKQPRLDRPASHPLLSPFPDTPVELQPPMDNLAAQKLIHSLNAFRIELGGCQSADLNNGYQAQDLIRFRSEVDHVSQLLTAYIDKAQPTDYPETSKPGM